MGCRGLFGKSFLFYTGYYNKESINLVDGSELTKSHVQKYLIDCIDNSGHGLIDDFRTLWPYSISNKDYPYAIGLEYAGDENKEVVLHLNILMQVLDRQVIWLFWHTD